MGGEGSGRIRERLYLDECLTITAPKKPNVAGGAGMLTLPLNDGKGPDVRHDIYLERVKVGAWPQWLMRCPHCGRRCRKLFAPNVFEVGCWKCFNLVHRRPSYELRLQKSRTETASRLSFVPFWRQRNTTQGPVEYAYHAAHPNAAS